MSKLYVVGIGPGGYEQMTVKAVKVLEECDIIVGYTVYVDLVAEHFAGKEMLTTPMRQEEKRCRMAFDEVMKGRNTAMICSGDAGVYGMSGLIYEISRDYPGIEIEIVSGVTAALSGGAVLGAPLMHDFVHTERQGMVRFSFSHGNTEEEVRRAAAALREMTEQ